MSLGLAIGKFLPLHRGHRSLLETARARCDDVVAIICDAGWHDVDAELRAGWIAESVPGIRSLVVDQDELRLADDDTEGWAKATLDALGARPDVVFTSEDYGPRYASLMGAEHVMVDRNRTAHPIAGSAIRAQPHAHLDWLDPHVRAHYVTRVSVIGAESTGKTTLALALAAHYGVGHVGEFGRVYTEAMPDPGRYRWVTRDFRLIAEAQAALEDDTARWCPPPLICDTNPFLTALFHEAYLGRPDPELERAAKERHYDVFVLTDPATPFEQDHTGLRRDGPPRRTMHRRCREYAHSTDARLVEVSGSPGERVLQAVEVIDRAMGRVRAR